MLLALDLAIVSRRKWWAAATLPIATLATLLHTSFAPLAAFAVAPALYLARQRSRWLPLGLGVLAVLLLIAPFILYEFQINWKDYPNLRYYSSLQSYVDLDALRWLLAVTTGWMLPNDDVVSPPQRVIWPPLVDAAAFAALVLLSVATLFALATVLRPNKAINRLTRLRLAVLVLWLVLPVVVSIRHWQPLFLHYFFFAFPAVALLVAFAIASAGRLLRPIGYAALALVVGVQGFNTLGGNAYQAAAAGSDPCFFPSIAAARANAEEVARVGHAAGSNAAVVELDAADSKALAYLLRADFPSIYLPHPVTTSQTPKLFGNVGLGAANPSQALATGSSVMPPVLTATQSVDAHFPNGVTAQGAAFSAESDFNQRVQVALTWSVDAHATATRPVVWRMTLLDGRGELVQTDPATASCRLRVRTTPPCPGSRSTRAARSPDQRAPGSYTLRLEAPGHLGRSAKRAVLCGCHRRLASARRSAGRSRPFQPCDLPSAIP